MLRFEFASTRATRTTRGASLNQKIRAVLVPRARLVSIRRDIENKVRSMLKEYGLLFSRAIGAPFRQQVVEMMDASPFRPALAGTRRHWRQDSWLAWLKFLREGSRASEASQSAFWLRNALWAFSIRPAATENSLYPRPMT
jgi:hypothetical protein